MKWVKAAISFLIAILIIPTIILAVNDSTDLKETRTVSFTLLEKNENTFDITSGTFNELLNNKFIINYDIKSNYPLVTQEDLEIANYYISEELKNSFIDRETNPKIVENVGKITFDGSEDWIHNNTANTDEYYSMRLTLTNFDSGLMDVSYGTITSEYTVTYVPANDIYIYTNGNQFYLKLPATSANEYKQYLSQNPLIVTYELETPITRPAELYDLKTFKLYYDTSSIKVKFDVNDNDYLWEIYYTDHLQTIRGEHEVGNTWTVNFYVYDIQHSYIRNLILLIPLIYTAGLILYLTNTFKRE